MVDEKRVEQEPAQSAEKIPNVSNIWQLAAYYAVKQGDKLIVGAAIVVAWVVMFVPELDRHSVNTQAMRDMMIQQEKQIDELRRLLDAQRTAADLLDHMLNRMIGHDAKTR